MYKILTFALYSVRSILLVRHGWRCRQVVKVDDEDAVVPSFVLNGTNCRLAEKFATWRNKRGNL